MVIVEYACAGMCFRQVRGLSHTFPLLRSPSRRSWRKVYKWWTSSPFMSWELNMSVHYDADLTDVSFCSLSCFITSTSAGGSWPGCIICAQVTSLVQRHTQNDWRRKDFSFTFYRFFFIFCIYLEILIFILFYAFFCIFWTYSFYFILCFFLHLFGHMIFFLMLFSAFIWTY